MSLRSLTNQALTIQRRGTVALDQYNNEVPGTEATVTARGYAEQTAATEIIVDRQTYLTDWLVVIYGTPAISASDRITVDGHTLQVVGEPERAWNPRTRKTSHVEARCTEVTG